jgi:hypothetical protein
MARLSCCGTAGSGAGRNFDREAAPSVERGERVIDGEGDGMGNAVANAPGSKVMLRIGKPFADSLQFQATNLTGRRDQDEIGPAGFSAHSSELAGGSLISDFSRRNVAPLPIRPAMIAKQFHAAQMQGDFQRPDRWHLPQTHLAPLSQDKKRRDGHGRPPGKS